MCCSVLQCVAVCLSVLQCGAGSPWRMHSGLAALDGRIKGCLYHTATYSSTLQHTATHCNTHCNTLRYAATRHSRMNPPQYSKQSWYILNLSTATCTTQQHIDTHSNTCCKTLQHVPRHDKSTKQDPVAVCVAACAAACAAMCCSVLQCVAVCCSVLQRLICHLHVT